MALQPDTTNVSFGTWPATTSVVRAVGLTGATGAVTGVITGAGAAAFTVTASASSASVTFQSAAVGSFTATLTLTDAGTGTSAQVALSGSTKTNALVFTPAALHFGNVIVGAPINLSLHAENPGPLDATLSITAGAFTLQATQVPPGSANNIVVFFTAPATGPFTATVTAAWNLPVDATGVTLGTPAGTNTMDGTGVLPVVAQTETTGVSGTRQRLLVDVPNPPAQMTLGARVLNTDASNPSTVIDGFGLGTPGHGFLNTRGDSSNLWLRAMKSLVMEARASDSNESSQGIWMVSNGNLAASCAGTASFIGAGGVVIAANKGPVPGEDGNPVNADSSLDNPPVTDKAEARQGVSSKAALAFGSIDAIIAFSFGVRGIYNLVKGAINDSKLPFTSLAATVGIAGAAGGFAGFSMGVAGLTGKVSGVTIYGEAGVVIGSGGFTGIHSISSLVLTSVFPLMFGVDAEIFAMDALTLTGMRHATLASHKDVTIQSDGNVNIKANGGGFGPIGSSCLGTVKVQARESIVLHAHSLPLTGSSRIVATPDGFSMEGAEASMVIHAFGAPMPRSELQMEPETVSLGVSAAGGGYELALSGRNAFIMKANAGVPVAGAGHLQIAQGTVELAVGAVPNRLVLTAAEAKLGTAQTYVRVRGANVAIRSQGVVHIQ